MEESELPNPLDLVQLLLDLERLAILSVLVQRPATMVELLNASRVRGNILQRHLHRLMAARLVTAEIESGETYYRLNRDRMIFLAQAFGRANHPEAALPPALLNLDETQRKFAAGYVNRDGSLKEIPAQFNRLQAVLAYIVQAFEPGKQYPEKAVNDLLRPFHPDTASLRRYLVDSGFLDRERNGSFYWRKEKLEELPA